MATAIKSIPFVVPTQPVPSIRSIPQQDLARILELRRDIETLEADLKSAEQSIHEQLEAGASVESGLFQAYLKTTERRSVSWKGVVERELGEDYARRVLAATKPDTFTHLVVEA
jgi:hypothetical protein